MYVRRFVSFAIGESRFQDDSIANEPHLKRNISGYILSTSGVSSIKLRADAHLCVILRPRLLLFIAMQFHASRRGKKMLNYCLDKNKKNEGTHRGEDWAERPATMLPRLLGRELCQAITWDEKKKMYVYTCMDTFRTSHY